MEGVEYSAEEIRPNGHRASGRLSRGYYDEMSEKGPFEYRLCESLVVAPQEGSVDIRLQIQGHEDNWKTGVSFYGVRLVPVTSASNDRSMVTPLIPYPRGETSFFVPYD
jgi:hypothetical protein